MRSHARVVIIGGGIVGCSILYHLTRLGWTDVMLLERSELTSGSTWHAAAGFGVLHDNSNMARLNYYSIECYRQLEKETGQSCGIHTTGGLYLAQESVRFDQLKIMEAKAETLGFNFEFIPPEKISDFHPLLNTEGLRGAWFQPDEGHLDPSGITHGFASAARSAGAEVVRFCPVLETNPQQNGGWEVVTEQGNVKAEIIVNAAGLWAREVGKMAGLNLPLIPMEHQYLITESIPEIVASADEFPSVSDRDAEYYMRQEGEGLLVGAYEKLGKHWSVDGTPLDFGHELLPEDLDRISANLERAMSRIPVLRQAGVKRVINGPMMWSPDTTGLLGPVPGLSNYYSATGIMTGIAQGGGLGKTLAEWIVAGEPEYDLNALDIARFGDYFTREHILARSLENNSTRFRIHFPYEVLESGRPQRVRAHFSQQQQQGAVFGVSFGWENPLYFARDKSERNPGFAFRRARWFGPVSRECLHLRKYGGIIDISPYAKYRVSGDEAEQWLDRLTTNRLPSMKGRIVLAPMVNENGRLVADFTISRVVVAEFLLIGSGSARVFHRRWFDQFLPSEGVFMEDLTDKLVGLSVSGPRATAFMTAMLKEDFGAEDLPYLHYRQTRWRGDITHLLRISYTGESGYEVYLPAAGFAEKYQEIRLAAKQNRIGFAGTLAQNSLRLEKSYGSWFTEFNGDYGPYESGLSRYIKLDKGKFIGRTVLLEAAGKTPEHRLCLFEVDSDDEAFGAEPVKIGDRIVGEITSGGYGHNVRKSLAMGYIRTTDIDPNGDFRIAIVGRWQPAKLCRVAPYDPDGLRLSDQVEISR